MVQRVEIRSTQLVFLRSWYPAMCTYSSSLSFSPSLSIFYLSSLSIFSYLLSHFNLLFFSSANKLQAFSTLACQRVSLVSTSLKVISRYETLRTILFLILIPLLPSSLRSSSCACIPLLYSFHAWSIDSPSSRVVCLCIDICYVDRRDLEQIDVWAFTPTFSFKRHVRDRLLFET